jgi:hypothetical protein
MELTSIHFSAEVFSLVEVRLLTGNLFPSRNDLPGLWRTVTAFLIYWEREWTQQLPIHPI